jgi:RNA polymerase sigma factor (sigma-70 family)
MLQRLRLLSRRYPGVPADRLEDLAAEKALELVQRLDCGGWRPLDTSAGELVSFISTVARNALVDELRRERQGPATPQEQVRRMAETQGRITVAPDLQLERRKFVERLVNCADTLKAEHRTVWLFRVLYELPSKVIAAHPEVRLKASHVDVILNRCRAQILACMTAHGYAVGELPAGTFAELWARYRGETSPDEAAHD